MRFLSTWNYLLIFGMLCVVETSWAQDAQIPPPLNPDTPPWAMPPGYGTPTPTPPPGAGRGGTTDSFFVPVQPSPDGFDSFDDESGSFRGSSSSGRSRRGRSTREGKSSFKLVEPLDQKVCRAWGSSLLGPTTFADRGTCEFALEREVDSGKAAIEELYDNIERFKLRKVIRKEIRDRKEAEKYKVKFSALRNTLQTAARNGCECQD